MTNLLFIRYRATGNNNKNNRKEPSMSKKKPMLEIFSVQEPAEGSDKKPFYTKVAVIWPHEKGDGGNLDIIPGVSLSGRLVAFPPREKSQEEAA
jgi:hypothetical protein